MRSLLGWFDPKSALVTVIVAPLLLYLAKIFLAHLKKGGAYLLEGFLYWISRLLKHSLAGSLTLRRYCRIQLAGQSQYLYVPSSRDVKLPIDRVFVTLSLDFQGGAKESYTQAELTQIGNRLIIAGDPGSGKSSLVKWLFRDTCKSAQKNPSKTRLPVLAELKNLQIPSNVRNNSLGSWLYRMLQAETSKARVYQMEQCFEAYAQTSGLLVLLDGLDEVASHDYPRVESAILGLSKVLANASDKNILIVTTRVQFLHQIRDAYRDFFGPVLFLRAFTPSDIYEFLTRWPFTSDSDGAIGRIYNELTDKPTLREMCRNPLVLSMFVAESQSKGLSIDHETRTEFYSKVTEELVIRRRLYQKGGAIAGGPKLREQREKILGRLALEHLLDRYQPANLLTWEAALNVTQEVSGCTAFEAESLFREIAKETGLVTEERIGHTFRFIHLTFCEFLAAYEAVQASENGWQNLLANHRMFQSHDEPQLKSRLVEVIPFAGGLLPRSRRGQAIKELSELHDDRLLARTFLETKLYEHQEWPRFVEREMSELIEVPESEWNEGWLQRLYLFNVAVLDAARCAEHVKTIDVSVNLQEFFRQLVEKQRASLSKLLYAYAIQDAAAAFRLAEICRLDLAQDHPDLVVSNCDQMPFFDLVKQRLSSDIERTALWASLLTEAGLRSRIVAVWLSSAAPLPRLDNLVARLPRNKRWWRMGLVNQTLFTQCLSISASEKVGANLPLLDALKAVPPPGRDKVSRNFILTVFACSAVGLLFLLPKHEALRGRTITVEFVIFASCWVLFCVSYFLAFRHSSLRLAYRLILRDRGTSNPGAGVNREARAIPGKFATRRVRLLQEWIIGRECARRINGFLRMRREYVGESVTE